MIGSMDLGMALGAPSVEDGSLECVAIDVGRSNSEMVGGRGSVPRMASEAEKRWRLVQQVVRHGPVGVVADRAVLFDRSVLVNERPLLVCMAFVAREVDRFRLEVSV